MVSLDFRLVGLDDSSPSREFAANVLPSEWNKTGPDSYTLRYKHEQSSLVFLLKLIKLSTRSLVHGIAIETDRTTSLDILTTDYISSSFFPHDVSITDAQPLANGFNSPARIKDLLSLYKISILQKLVPGLSKEGYQEESTATSQSASSAAQASSQSEQAQGPVRRQSPPFTGGTPYELPRPPRLGQPYNPLSIGRSDLDPIPLHGGNPFAPPSLFGGAGEGDGMFVGRDHPMFRDRFQGPGIGPFAPGGGSRQGRWGGDGYLPPGAVPPGARFDPIGPEPDMGPMGPMGPTGMFNPLGGRGLRSGDPDHDEFMPPGFGGPGHGSGAGHGFGSGGTGGSGGFGGNMFS